MPPAENHHVVRKEIGDGDLSRSVLVDTMVWGDETVTEANNLPFQFWYKWSDGLNMTINLINFPKNVTELTYTWRSDTTRNTTTRAVSSPTTTQSPTTEDPPNNFNAATPEAVFLTNEVFLHYVLPALICVVLVGVIAIMFLCIRRQRRLCSEGINDNNTGNEVLYADLELNATNNYQVRCDEESPYAQIQISQTTKK
ncbi:unnamed protein product [Spodoptera exigua]|nr:unnamed protein product [Spodoptera exigua]